ncbi:unnamed protein product [Bemisia tabaci]|uniref:Carboxylic ester hydrolase n=2 Tax=Bemisia tabaci TaxID=7038 RepID=A0A9P0A4F9_BEMTA|nr:unnamed protein product [Bemisia tabaci]
MERRLYVVLVLSVSAISAADIEVTLPKGKIVGRDGIKTRGGRNICSFTGIPYAEPPIYQHRFQEPVPKQPWRGILNATLHGRQCPQKNVYSLGKKHETVGSEDCLHLNVFTPEINAGASMPVMVYIHGGSYQQGSNYRYIYGPEYILDKDIVLVTINYRLAALGFLSLGDEVFPGNLGLKDQALALEWINENIKFFGGNPDLVTIFGDSAGGASTSLHMFSPLSKGLFHRAISMSGTALCPWAVIPQPLAKDRGRAFLTLLGCPTEPSTKALECLQNTPLEAIMNVQLKFYEWLFLPLVIFGPVIEEKGRPGAFLTLNPKTARPESSIPYIAGFSSGEGGIVASGLFTKAPHFVQDLETAPDRLLPLLLNLRGKYDQRALDDISEQIKGYYFGGRQINNDTIPEFIDMITDNWFMYGTLAAGVRWGSPAYLYYYDYPSALSYNQIFGDGSIKSVSHSDILLNLFPLTAYFPNRVLSKEENKVSSRILDLWTGFASEVAWGIQEHDWQPINMENRIRFLHITQDKPIMSDNLLHDRYQFWKALDYTQGGKLAVII